MPQLMLNDLPVSPVEIADTWATRARGMLFRKSLPAALLIRPCSSVHGAWMRVRLDVAFLSDDGTVVDVCVLHPWGLTRPRRGIADVLEAPAGSFARWGLAPGSVIRIADDGGTPTP